jgi:GAF domain/Inner membrane component of T3SS, cytoplasmic domain
MPARLSVYAEGPVVVHRLPDGGDYLLGRGAECDVRVVDDRVSRRHARLSHSAEEGWRIADLGSKNGLAVDERTVGGCALPAAAAISLGGLLVRFEPLGEAALRADAESELDRRRDGARMQRELDPSAGLRALLDRLLTSVMTVAGAERGLLLLTHPDGDLRLARVAGLAAEDVEREEFSGSLGAARQAIAERRPLVSRDATTDSRLRGRSSVQSSGIRALVCLPLLVLDEVVGVVYADSREPGRELTDLDVDILSGLATHAALALAVAGLQDEVEGLEGAIGLSARGASGAWRRLTAARKLMELP